MLTNRIKAKYNIEEIDKDFDIFEVSSDSEKDIDKNILDINTDDKRYNARSVVYTWGKTCFMMFDKGYMTFESDKTLVVSPWISPMNQKRLGIYTGMKITKLPLDEEREKYLIYHRENVYKG